MIDWINGLSYFQWLIVAIGVNVVIFITGVAGAEWYERRTNRKNDDDINDWDDVHIPKQRDSDGS